MVHQDKSHTWWEETSPDELVHVLGRPSSLSLVTTQLFGERSPHVSDGLNLLLVVLEQLVRQDLLILEHLVFEVEVAVIHYFSLEHGLHSLHELLLLQLRHIAPVEVGTAVQGEEGAGDHVSVDQVHLVIHLNKDSRQLVVGEPVSDQQVSQLISRLKVRNSLETAILIVLVVLDIK